MKCPRRPAPPGSTRSTSKASGWKRRRASVRRRPRPRRGSAPSSRRCSPASASARSSPRSWRPATRRSISSISSASCSAGTTRLEDAAQTILREVSDVVGARRASIMVHDERTDLLRPVAARGFNADDTPPVGVADEHSVAARVFRERRIVAQDPGRRHRRERRGAAGRWRRARLSGPRLPQRADRVRRARRNGAMRRRDQPDRPDRR